MNGKIIGLVLCAASLLLGGCAMSPHRAAYEKAKIAYGEGKDDDALKNVLNSLKIKPDYQPSLDLLSQIYDDVVQMHREAIKSLKKDKKNKTRWDEIVLHEEKIADFNRDIKLIARRSDMFSATINDNENELSTAIDSAAFWNFQYGLDMMEDGSKQAQRRAAVYFGKTLDYDKNYPDAEELYDKCRQNGMMRIVVDKLKGDYSGRIDGAVISALQKDEAATEFISFVNRSDLDRLLQEQSLSLSGDFIEGSGVDMVGRLLDAQYVVVGSVEKTECAEEPQVEHYEKAVSATVDTGRKNCTSSTDTKGQTRRHCVNEYVEVHGEMSADTLKRKASIAGSVKLLDVATGEIKKSVDIRAGVMSTSVNVDCSGAPEACARVKKQNAKNLRTCDELRDQLAVEFSKKAVKGISAYTTKLSK